MVWFLLRLKFPFGIDMMQWQHWRKHLLIKLKWRLYILQWRKQREPEGPKRLKKLVFFLVFTVSNKRASNPKKNAVLLQAIPSFLNTHWQVKGHSHFRPTKLMLWPRNLLILSMVYWLSWVLPPYWGDSHVVRGFITTHWGRSRRSLTTQYERR